MPCDYGTISVDVAVVRLNALIHDAKEQAIPCGIINSKTKFPHWRSVSLRFYIKKKNYFVDVLKRRNTTIFTDRFIWMKSIDKNLKPQLKQFWKCVASFRIINSASIQLENAGKHLVRFCGVADELTQYFSQYITICVMMSPPPFRLLLNFYL